MLPYILALYPAALCGAALIWLHQANRHPRAHWGIRALVSASIIAFAFLACPWAFSSIYLRYVAIGLYLLIAVHSYRSISRADLRSTTPSLLRPIFAIAVLSLFSLLNILAVASKIEPAGAFDLALPLRGGNYYVLQGGRNITTNPFHVIGGSRFSVDLAKLNVFGNRAAGIAPRDLDAYEIFGETIYSPCNGIVLKVRDGLTDNTPGKVDSEYPEGNYVVLECGDARVLMAHLMQDSILFAAGKTVALGEPLGKVGNSGNTSEPHLHIDANRGEAEIPLKFDGQWLSMNSVIRARRDEGRQL